MRGFKSKKKSLENILETVRPSMVLLNETQMVGRMKMSLDGYTSWVRNRSDRGGGGIATSVRQNHQDSAVGVCQGEDDDEFLITRIDTFSPALCVINSYGEQRRTKKEEVEAKWSRLMKEMETVRMRGEYCVYAGDLNKLVGTGEFGVPGNSPEVSLGGRMLRELLAAGNWSLVNGLGNEVVQGGPFTREDPATGTISCLDLWVVSRELLPFVNSLVIDKEKKMTPYRATREKKKYKLTYTDHLSSILILKNLPRRKKVKEQKKTIWNLAKPNAWKEYEKVSDSYGEELEKIIEDTTIPIQEAMNKFEKIHQKIKFKVFGKVCINDEKNKRPNREINMDEEQQAKIIFEEQVKTVEAELDKLKETKGKAGQVWKIREKVIGGKKKKLASSAIVNPKTNKLVVNKDEIKEVTLKYCVDTLTSNKPEGDFQKEINEKRQEVKLMMKMDDGIFECNEETFKYNIKKFKRSGKKNYDF